MNWWEWLLLMVALVLFGPFLLVGGMIFGQWWLENTVGRMLDWWESR